jgi:hypothetical protein
MLKFLLVRQSRVQQSLKKQRSLTVGHKQFKTCNLCYITMMIPIRMLKTCNFCYITMMIPVRMSKTYNFCYVTMMIPVRACSV